MKHAVNRAKERFGLDLDTYAVRAIAHRIQQGDAQFIKRKSWRLTVWRIIYRDREMKVMYDRKHHIPVTFMEP